MLVQVGALRSSSSAIKINHETIVGKIVAIRRPASVRNETDLTYEAGLGYGKAS